ncbi:aspartate/glutamate racemase family protein [Rhodococcus rhodochrous]|uniref:Aspartate/glutamate racemase family protein n=1 Tax=Rhodococcus rhodochrous KG-21 TaxID=1441923 RepID=A0A0M9WQC2_RHORH|nr:aspartate/glutamate racemase family protein [Rhodococcus rhodochrous]KOS57603.1 hypothetical protein Z051_03795 [Rhodococcus rhodochrous KG-21]
MTVYHARRGQVSYGYPIGMLCAEWHIPFIPGDLNHASTFDFPVRYLTVPEVSGASVLTGTGHFAEALIRAAKQLQSEGVRAITSNCGFMARYQRAVAEHVDIPVFLSSLLQIPMITSMLGSGKSVGILAANSAALTPDLLESVGITDARRLVVHGLEQYEHFNEVVLQETGILDDQRLTAEVVAAALEIRRTTPDLGAYLLECSDLPVYSDAIYRATGLPVYDWAGFIDYVHRSISPRTYTGIY